MDKILNFVEKITGFTPPVQIKIIISISIILVFWIIKKLFFIILNRRIEDVRSQYIWRKTINYISFIIIFLLIGNIWFKGLKSINTFLGLLSAGVAIALKDLLINITGWFFIVLKKPFIVGDRIQIGKSSGDVIDIRIFQFTILEIGNWVEADQSTGRVIHIPNGKVFTEEVANYTQGFQYIWDEIPVLVTFESNWKKAKEILKNIIFNLPENLTEKMKKELREASKKYMIFYKELNPIIYTKVKDNGILLTIRYLCNARHRRGMEQHLWEQILEAFSKEKDIDFAYTTIRYYDNSKEGKE